MSRAVREPDRRRKLGMVRAAEHLIAAANDDVWSSAVQLANF
jgi:hypothetical protein